jgi:hypothetical protein
MATGADVRAVVSTGQELEGDYRAHDDQNRDDR